jgi:hypothetical protein
MLIDAVAGCQRKRTKLGLEGSPVTRKLGPGRRRIPSLLFLKYVYG